MADDELRRLEREDATQHTATTLAALARALAHRGRADDAHARACEALRRDPASAVRDLVRAEPARHEPQRPGSSPDAPLRARFLPLGPEPVGGVADLGRGLVAAALGAEFAIVDVIAGDIRRRAPWRNVFLGARGTGAYGCAEPRGGDEVMSWVDAATGATRWELARPIGRTTYFGCYGDERIAWGSDRAFLFVDVATGEVIEERAPPSDVLFRLAGDRFLGLHSNLGHESPIRVLARDLSIIWSAGPVMYPRLWADWRLIVLATPTLDDHEVRCFDLETGTERRGLRPARPLYPLTLAGGRLVCSTHEQTDRDDDLVGIDLETGAESWRVTWPGSPGRRSQVLDAFGSDDGRLLAVSHQRPLSRQRGASHVASVDPTTGTVRARVDLAPALVVPRGGARELLGSTEGILAAGCLVLPATSRNGRRLRGDQEGVVIVDAPRAAVATPADRHST